MTTTPTPTQSSIAANEDFWARLWPDAPPPPAGLHGQGLYNWYRANYGDPDLLDALGDGCSWHDATCKLGEAAQNAAGSVLEDLARKSAESVAWLIKGSASWWVQVEGIDPANEPAAIGQLRSYVFPFVVAMLVGG